MRQILQMGCESIRRATAGEPESLHHLADSVQQRVYPYINRVILDTDVSSDLTQDTLLRVLTSLPRLRNVDHFWPWVYAIAANATRQHLRIKRRKREIPFSVVNPVMLESRFASAEPRAAASSTGDLGLRAVKAMAGLRPRYRTALSLRVFKGLSYRDIAARLGCGEICARGLVLRAKRALIRKLANEDGGIPRLSTTRYDQRRRLIS
jgi:RNA polymerase sigma-70 factor, ECF subfamily